VAILLAVATSWYLSLRLGRPLRELANAAQSAARGDFQRRFKAEGEGEIARLTRAFDSLLSDLREKNEVENYIADLAKYQPEGTSDHAVGPRGTATSPESLSGAFLAVRLHDILDASLAMPDKAVMAFNQVVRNLEVPAKLNGGKLAATAGNTAFLVFDNAEAAFAVAGQILHGAAAHGQKLSAAAALGTIVTGPVEWTSGGTASLLGVPVRQLEELLPDAIPGMLLVTAEFAKATRDLTGAKLRNVTGAVSGQEVSALEMPKPEPSTPIAGGTLAGTQRIGGSGVLSGMPKLFPGMVLGSRYEILSELGTGGMGVVYKARDRQLNEVVAIKTLKSEDSLGTPLLDAMKSEIRLARKITHRNVLRIYDFGEVGGVAFISMEYVHGMTLRYLLQNRARLPFAAGLRIMRQMCTALQVAHEQSVLHRDIKPENVMLEPSGNAKLMDFGLASRMRYDDNPAAKRMVVGTLHYASPEQLRGEEVDERTDLYACGVMMYQMFTGKLPFNEGGLEEMVEKKSRQEYQPPAVHVTGFPAPLAALIDACLKADRELRPKSAAAMLEFLENMHL
jgi:serine/threonine-protein kinase